MTNEDNNVDRAYDIYTNLENAIGNCTHYRSIGDREMYLWWEERVAEIEEDLLELIYKLKGDKK
jgi:hypothetical protein